MRRLFSENEIPSIREKEEFCICIARNAIRTRGQVEGSFHPNAQFTFLRDEQQADLKEDLLLIILNELMILVQSDRN